MNTSRRNNIISQINSWLHLVHNYVASPNLSKLLSNDNPGMRKYILNSLNEQYTEMAYLFSKLCKWVID
jgi:hypothetical protein